MRYNMCMRPFGTSKQLAARRKRAKALLRSGQSPNRVAQRVGVTVQSVRRWRREASGPKRQPKRQPRGPGRPGRLNASQCRCLLRDLARGAFHHGYADAYWTLDRIAHVSWEMFRVRYRSHSVWYLMRRLGWSCPQLQRRALHRDDEAIAHWKQYIWPHIKKVAATRRDACFSR
jgi:transposase